jgi:uncharacterized membrane protein YhiD involved in acid resistance
MSFLGASNLVWFWRAIFVTILIFFLVWLAGRVELSYSVKPLEAKVAGYQKMFRDERDARRRVESRMRQVQKELDLMYSEIQKRSKDAVKKATVMVPSSPNCSYNNDLVGVLNTARGYSN